ncbi:MAG: molybdate ABC transporter substrate-binding protein [Acidimicrobiia bacterium]|nr:molybdate ABC transporter substrate-binding protein [Acidimicrobiia bacterium]
MTIGRVVVGALAVSLLVPACGGDDAGGGAPGAGATEAEAGTVTGGITVLAAASLTEAFTELGERFESAHPAASVTLSFAASSAIVAQIQEGAPADVFASADEANMGKVVESGDVRGEPVVFAANALQIAVESGNPKGIRALGDLAADGTVVVLCESQVPCGRLADQVLASAGVSVTPASREANVKAALGKVELGEADAALVYATDVLASDDVEGVEIPEDVNLATRYPVAVLEGAGNPEGARAFVELLTSDDGQDVLRRHGFAGP